MRLTVEFDKKSISLMKKFSLAAHGQLNVAVGKGTKLAAQYVLAEVIKRIESRRYAPLAHRTRILRAFDGYGNIPLKRTGALVRSITREIKSETEAEIGLLVQRSAGPKGPGNFRNIGQIIHDGAVIKVTDAMRKAFARRMGAIERAAGGKFRRPAGGGSGVIRIPPRPFIKDVFEDPKVLERVTEIYVETLEKEFLLFNL